MMKQEQLDRCKAELISRVVKAAFGYAQENVPYFTEMLMVWAKENHYEEALTEFFGCFVKAAIEESMNFIADDLKGKAKQGDGHDGEDN